MPEAAKILIVDDEPTSRAILSRLLERRGFQCLTIEDGEQALQMILNEPPDLVLLDQKMPHLDGMEVCEIIRGEADIRISRIPIIMLTGHGGAGDESRCLELGADDFVAKPAHPDVLFSRIETQLRLARAMRDLEERNTELAEWRDNMEKELEAARLTQAAIMPIELPFLAGWRFSSVYQPSMAVGGDVYDVIQLPDGRFFFWVADATGHGAAAALVTTLISFQFRRAASRHSQVEEILMMVDREFRSVFRGVQLVTALGLAIDPATGHGEYAGAGHPPLLIIRNDGQIDSLPVHAPPIGVDDEAKIVPRPFFLAQGDRFLITTDGATGMETESGTRLGHDDFVKLTGSLANISPDEFLEELIEAVTDMAKSKRLDDDFCAIQGLRLPLF